LATIRFGKCLPVSLSKDAHKALAWLIWADDVKRKERGLNLKKVASSNLSTAWCM
jgi:hypothetical protein